MASGKIKGNSSALQIITMDVRYSTTRSSSITSGNTLTLQQKTTPIIPDGYLVRGLLASQSTTYEYTNTSVNQKMNGNSMFAVLLGTNYNEIPTSISGRFTVSNSQSVTKFFERTLTFILMPEGTIP